MLSEEYSEFVEKWGSMGVLWGINRSMARIHALIIIYDKPVDLDTVAAVLEAALDGRKATVLTLGDEERDVVLRLPDVRREDLGRLPLSTSAGTRMVLGDVARFVPAEGAREIFRRDQRRVARVTARQRRPL